MKLRVTPYACQDAVSLGLIFPLVVKPPHPACSAAASSSTVLYHETPLDACVESFQLGEIPNAHTWSVLVLENRLVMQGVAFLDVRKATETNLKQDLAAHLRTFLAQGLFKMQHVHWIARLTSGHEHCTTVIVQLWPFSDKARHAIDASILVSKKRKRKDEQDAQDATTYLPLFVFSWYAWHIHFLNVHRSLLIGCGKDRGSGGLVTKRPLCARHFSYALGSSQCAFDQASCRDHSHDVEDLYTLRAAAGYSTIQNDRIQMCPAAVMSEVEIWPSVWAPFQHQVRLQHKALIVPSTMTSFTTLQAAVYIDWPGTGTRAWETAVMQRRLLWRRHFTPSVAAAFAASTDGSVVNSEAAAAARTAHCGRASLAPCTRSISVDGGLDCACSRILNDVCT
jgi:hypothetical protein